MSAETDGLATDVARTRDLLIEALSWAESPEFGRLGAEAAARSLDDYVTEKVADALRDAGVKVANMRHVVTGRRVANAAYLGEVVYAMGMDLDYQRVRDNTPGSGAQRATTNDGGDHPS